MFQIEGPFGQKGGLLLVLLLCLGLLLSFPFALAFGPLRSIPVTLHTTLRADYGADRRLTPVPRVNLEIIAEVIRDVEPGAPDVPARFATVLAQLLTPVPTITPAVIGPTPSPAATRPAATPTAREVIGGASPTPGATASPMPAATRPPTATPAALASATPSPAQSTATASALLPTATPPPLLPTVALPGATLPPVLPTDTLPGATLPPVLPTDTLPGATLPPLLPTATLPGATLPPLLPTATQSEDIACRYGGEEFVVILPEAPLDDTLKRAEQLREGVRQLQVRHHDQTLGSVTVSPGVAAFPEHGSTTEAIMQAADAALYRAKREGRDRVVVASG